jgi:Ser/Thr protein kinase RdoA (MazF antagonist)
MLNAIASTGIVVDGRMLALNSYENRVYQIGVEGSDPVVAKFYRPGRWSDASIIEEHAFARELADADTCSITRGSSSVSGLGRAATGRS